MNKTKIILELEDRKFTIEFPEDLDVYQMEDILKLVLYAQTFHPDSVEAIFPEE